MKKCLLLFVGLVSAMAYSQEKPFKDLDSLSFKKAISEITSVSANGYKQDTIVGDHIYFRKQGEENPFLIKYYKYNKGENKDLGVAGVPVYSINEVVGEFKLVFPILQQFFNPNADAEKILKERGKFTTKYSIRKWYDLWILRF
ncbi:hypothetical protein [Ornithobacterium rhinotracheale]|uniref:Uncharacterized protein n=2 Tax=Ornithobacterium rhinotracheale TaxID=28251 RepID=I4A354_ORNRL|nr:hypothetical protein [Ornithobacterium rhinotracheale]AFL98388.1 hypothetical protein Ornrh_2257 [Ornithobacterium rhinotracheale DSM 15997]MCK0193263.1 hypothetical protein [Ornithobacterium rhinotracheale]MCK0201135.1 hypothetical protein [Ornithobacterium rhinotracheale]UOH63315.1 hypothetical protein MT993_09900 [Ornithobacterium rhinotracheale]UOH66661.1 hypothetical protein MT999_04425 [Ornithobacterium rhinotracheale]